MLSRVLLSTYILRYGAIGSFVFSLVMLFHIKTGLIFKARDENGFVRKDIPPMGYLVISTVFIGLLWAQVYGYHDMLRCLSVELTFTDIFVLNYCLYLFEFAFDTIVIDMLVLVTWKPTFLGLPDVEGFTSAEHHLKTVPKGIAMGAVGTLLSTVLIWYLL